MEIIPLPGAKDVPTRKVVLRGMPGAFDMCFVDEVKARAGAAAGAGTGAGAGVGACFSDPDDPDMLVNVCKVAAVIAAKAPCPWTVHALLWMYKTQQPMMTPSTAVKTMMAIRDDVPLICRDRFLFSLSMAVYFIAMGAQLPTYIRDADTVLCVNAVRKQFLARGVDSAPAATPSKVSNGLQAVFVRHRHRESSIAETVFYVRFRLFGALLLLLHARTHGKHGGGEASSQGKAGAGAAAADASAHRRRDAAAASGPGPLFHVQATRSDGRTDATPAPITAQLMRARWTDSSDATPDELAEKDSDKDNQVINNVIIKDLQAMKALFPVNCSETHLAEHLIIVMDMKKQ